MAIHATGPRGTVKQIGPNSCKGSLKYVTEYMKRRTKFGTDTSMPTRGQIVKPIGDRLLTLGEAEAILRLHPRTVRAYVKRGEIEARIIGGRWRFRRGDLDAFFESAPRYWDFKAK
jgi:excisionase family DNA binding protein